MPDHTIFVTSPLEPEHVARIGTVAPSRVEVLYEPDLYPPTRYIADHKGGPFTRSNDPVCPSSSRPQLGLGLRL